MMTIGYIGMGIMGRPMAMNLLKAGYAVTVWNRTAEKCAELGKAGATVAGSVAALAAAVDVVMINVTDTADVEAVLFGEGGAAGAIREGSVVIDNSTISAKATQEFAARLKEKGVDYLDAPVSGGDIGAQKGTLAIMAGGEEAVFERCKGIFEVLGSKVVHVGGVGMGQTCKACNQLFCALHMLACCEGIALAEKAGLDAGIMVDVVSSGAGGSWALQNLGPKITEGDMEPGFMIDLLVKDLNLTMELARGVKVPVAGLTIAQQLFEAAKKNGLGKKGTQALMKVVEQLAEIHNE